MAIFTDKTKFQVSIYLHSIRNKDLHSGKIIPILHKKFTVRISPDEIKVMTVGRSGEHTRRSMARKEAKEEGKLMTNQQRAIVNYIHDIPLPREYRISEDHAVIEITQRDISIIDSKSTHGSRYNEGLSGEEFTEMTPNRRYLLVAPCRLRCGTTNNFVEIQITKAAWSLF